MESTSRFTWLNKQIDRIPDFQGNSSLSIPLSDVQAKEKVLDHWDYLDRLCKKRFPYNCNLAHEGLLFIIESLEKDNWQRVRTWQGKGKFSTYVSTLGSRLLTDFQRRKQGHIRSPKWIKEKTDPVWAHAYQLLIVETCSRQEAIHRLHTTYSFKELYTIEKVVATVLAHCEIRLKASEQEVDIDNTCHTVSSRYSPETELTIGDEELSAVLWQILQDNQSLTPHLCARINNLTSRLKPHLTLSEEDKLLLRLRFVDGLEIKKISQLMKLTGTPYKRLQKVLKGLRRSFEKAKMDEC